MHKLRIYTLGTFQVFLNQRQIQGFDTDKTRALLAYLAAERDHPHPREQLAGLLWSDQPEERALHSLRQALSGLRKALGETSSALPNQSKILIIQSVDNTIFINPEIDTWIDCSEFEALLDKAYRHYTNSTTGGSLNFRRLKQATELYRGRFLSSFYLKGSPLFDEWAMLKREHIDQRMVEALSYLADYYEQRGDHIQARRAMQELADLVPWEENACIRIVTLLAEEGHWSAALAQAQNYVRYLQAEMMLEPSQAVVALIEDVQKQALRQIPPTRQRSLPPHNLPAPESPFVGRESDLDHLADFLSDPHCKLVTLTGMGGIGKTRTALETASEHAGIFKDGVFFVPLSGTSNFPEAIFALAASTGFRFFGERQPNEQIKSYLDGKNMLLVLDSLEHLLTTEETKNQLIAFLLEVLGGSNGLKVLVTSRVRLHLRLERVIELKGLDYPASLEEQTQEDYSAIRLFEQTAMHVRPDFTRTSDWLSTAQICRELDGVPLAIELAASWVHTQTPAEILDEIRRDIDSIATSMQDVNPRHRSMRAVFEHTWNLLSADEQKVFKRLAVFPDSFDPRVALVVSRSTAPLLTDLVQKSLLHHLENGRYGFHNLIKRYAAEKLAGDEQDYQETTKEFSRYFAEFLANRKDALKGFGQEQALAEMDQELGNWRATYLWLVENGWAEEIGLSSEAVYHYYNIRASFDEGIRLLSSAAEQLEEVSGQERSLGRTLSYIGSLAYRAHEDNLAQTALERSLKLLEDGNDPQALALCLVFWAGHLARIREHTAAQAALERSIDLFRRTEDAWGIGYALYLQGHFYNRKGMYAEADAVLRESLEATRRSGDKHREIGPLNLLGDGACQEGDYDLAQKYFEESLEISRSIQDRYNEALIEVNLGTVYHLRKQYPEARKLYEASLETCSDIGDKTGQAIALSNLGELLSDCGSYSEALPFFKQGLALSRSEHDDWAEISCLNNLAGTCLELEDLRAAQGYIRQGLEVLRGLDAPPIAAITLLQLARLWLQQGDRSSAEELLRIVLQVDGLEEDIRQKALQVCSLEGIAIPEDGPPTSSIEEKLAELLQKMQD